MSAITGIFYRDGRNVDEKQIKKMNDRLSHRGPDGSAIWCEGPVALGHQMLHTTPESLHEKLPFEEDGLVITADARIDNRKELSLKLGIEDKEEISDSYFILKAYQKWGEKCPEELLGDFAFAIWDKEKEKLFCARDHMGVKPFYYYLDDEGFLFSTEIKSIFTMPKIPCKVNDLRVAFHLIHLYNHKNLTFYKDIFRLPAACSITISSGKVNLRRYWELDPNYELKCDDEDYITGFSKIFSDAVRCRLRSAFPIGFELSGGLDSSSVFCMAKEYLNTKTPLNTFSIIFDDFSNIDERKYINHVTKVGLVHTDFLKADNINPLNEMESILFFVEEPFLTPNIAIVWNLYKRINQKGIRVLLGGEHGDVTLYRGEKYLFELFNNFNWVKLMEEISGISSRFKLSPFKLFLNQIIFPNFPSFIKKKWYDYKGYRTKPDIFILKKEFAQEIDADEYIKDHFLKEPKDSKSFHFLTLTLDSYQSFQEIMDRLSAAFSIEYRSPFYDKRLIEFCYAIPTEQKFKHGWDRMIMRRAMEGILPKKIQWRTSKAEFSSFFEKNLLMFEKNRLDDIFYNNEHDVIFRNYVDLGNVQYVYQKYKEGSKGSDPKDIWSVITTSLWLRYIKHAFGDASENIVE